jgi:hypothetical protein
LAFLIKLLKDGILTHELQPAEFPCSGLGDVDGVGTHVPVDGAARHVKKRQRVRDLGANVIMIIIFGDFRRKKLRFSENLML